MKLVMHYYYLSQDREFEAEVGVAPVNYSLSIRDIYILFLRK